MIYLLFGGQEAILQNKLKKIISSNYESTDEFNLVKIDARNIVAQDIVYESSLLPLGYDRKCVVVYNPYFLSTEKEKVSFDKDQNIDCLVEYCKNPNESTDLIFLANYEKLAENTKIVKAIKENGETFEARDLTSDEWPLFVKQLFEKKGATIDVDAATELIKRVDGNVMLCQREVEKLTLYSSHIRMKDIELVTVRALEDNVYGIFDYLIKGKNELAINLYRNLKSENIEPISLISLIESQFRFLAQVYFLYKGEHLNNFQISKELKANEFRVKKAIDNCKYISYKQILKALDDLYELDYNIKSLEVADRFFAFELFLLKFQAE